VLSRKGLVEAYIQEAMCARWHKQLQKSNDPHDGLAGCPVEFQAEELDRHRS
jgi:hypothetical protein